MELTRKTLENVKFHSKGKWYNAEEVDRFLAELTVAAEEAERKLWEEQNRSKGLSRQVETLREENERLQLELGEPGQKPENDVQVNVAEKLKELQDTLFSQEQHDLERERDQLLEDVRTLHRFRETFREAVIRDAKELLRQMEELESGGLL